MMTKQAVATKADIKPIAIVDAHEPPKMKADALIWQHVGFVWREACVRLPAEMLFTDLTLPEIWRNIQQSPQTELRRFDRLTIVAHDQTWCVKDVLVIAADHLGVTLAIKPADRIAMPVQTEEAV